MKKGRRKWLIIIPILIYFLYFFVTQQIKIFELQARIRETQRQIEAVQLRIDELEADETDLSSRRYVERQARQENNLVYPHEIIYELAQ